MKRLLYFLFLFKVLATDPVPLSNINTNDAKIIVNGGLTDGNLSDDIVYCTNVFGKAIQLRPTQTTHQTPFICPGSGRGFGGAPVISVVLQERQAALIAKAAAEKVATAKKTTITCVKGKLTKKVTAVKPVCPTGYKKK